jgi:hypothetical protein
MPTKLEKTVKREIDIDGQPFTVAISPEGLKITQKGFRKGQEVSWKSLLESSRGDGATTTSSANQGMSSLGEGGTGGGGHDSGFR